LRIDARLCVLIRRISVENPLWGAPPKAAERCENAPKSHRAAAERHGKICVGTLMLAEDY
jgi:hypothetical protein